MNGINIKSQLKHQHKLSYDAGIDEISDYQKRINDQNIPLTHRTKLVKVQDSLCSPSDGNYLWKAELTMREIKKKCKAPKLASVSSKGMSRKNRHDQQNLLLLHEQNFHPELTDRYDFKAGKRWVTDPQNNLSIDEEPEITQIDETIGPKSFVPIMMLGKGSFGEVYLVQKKSNKMFYAMKVLQKDKLMGQNLVKYARTERNVLSYTKHSFIVGLNYAFQTKEKLFLILDYCPGGDLGHVLAKEKRFDEDRARIYLAEVVLALEDLHKRDIIFRDLKPDNVVLDIEGHALLTDFGLSKEGINDNNGAKSFWGSIAYLAPEMLRRIGHGKSVDWYLLGVLLYEMLVGVPPYFTENKEQMFYNIQKGCLKIPSNLSREAKSLLIGLLNRNPQKRLGASKYDAEDIKKHPFFK